VTEEKIMQYTSRWNYHFLC